NRLESGSTWAVALPARRRPCLYGWRGGRCQHAIRRWCVVSAVSRTSQSPEGTASSPSASRRTFLKGVGLAGAAGLAAPLLAGTSARAATEGIVLGANVGAWNPPGKTLGWATEVPVTSAVGCRSYRDDVLSSAKDVEGLGAFPGLP